MVVSLVFAFVTTYFSKIIIVVVCSRHVMNVKMGSKFEARSIVICQITVVTVEFQAASPRCFPYTTACQLTQPVVGYTARDTALEFGPPSGTGKLIPLLLDAGTSRCTRSPQQADGIFPHLTHGHTSFTA